MSDTEPRILLYECVQAFTRAEAIASRIDMEPFARARAADRVRMTIARDAAIITDAYPDPHTPDMMRVQARSPDWRSALEVAEAAMAAACHAMTPDREPDEIESARLNLAETTNDMRDLLDKYQPPPIESTDP